MSSKICYIVGACNEFNYDFIIPNDENNLIIAADGGFDILKKHNIMPDILLGDFDSIENFPEHSNIIRHPQKKDDTDTFLAYKTAFLKGYRTFVILGGVGGRIDHTIANIQTLLNIAKYGGRAFLIGNGTILTAIYNEKINFSDKYNGYIGIFAQGSDAKDVCISGLKYCADHIILHPDIPMGVSNEFVGKSASISVGKGALLIVWNEKYNDFITHIDKLI